MHSPNRPFACSRVKAMREKVQYQSRNMSVAATTASAWHLAQYTLRHGSRPPETAAELERFPAYAVAGSGSTLMFPV